MSFEISDMYTEGISDCCGDMVIGDGEEGTCKRCGEHCSAIVEDDDEDFSGASHDNNGNEYPNTDR